MAVIPNTWCPETGRLKIECHCDACAETGPATLPTGFPAAAPVPEICREAYYGIPCTCPRQHRGIK